MSEEHRLKKVVIVSKGRHHIFEVNRGQVAPRARPYLDGNMYEVPSESW